MNNLQDILLFPVRDAEARKQFLFACVIALGGFIIPILPFIILTGYSAAIMRQMIEDKRPPSMPDWQKSDWSALLQDGLRLYGIQIALSIPLLLLIGVGFVFILSGGITTAILSEQSSNTFPTAGIVLVLFGSLFMVVVGIISLPYGVIIGAAGPHVVAKRSFTAGFDFKAWWQIFRKAIVQFILAYVIVLGISFVFALVMQVLVITIVLMCIFPIVIAPYTAYVSLITNTLFAKAYVTGLDALQATE